MGDLAEAARGLADLRRKLEQSRADVKCARERAARAERERDAHGHERNVLREELERLKVEHMRLAERFTDLTARHEAREEAYRDLLDAQEEEIRRRQQAEIATKQALECSERFEQRWDSLRDTMGASLRVECTDACREACAPAQEETAS